MRPASGTSSLKFQKKNGRTRFLVDPQERIVGQQVSARTLEEITPEIQQIEPPVFPQIDCVDVKPGVQVIVVQVSTGVNRPHSDKGQAYKRVGNKSARMSRDECNRMLIERVHSERCWETEPVAGWTVAIYQNRAEITSSGTLHFGLTPEKLFEPHGSLPWNPLIARAYYRRGIIENWGRGTLKVAELTERTGLPRPEIVEQAGCVVVRFRPIRYIPRRQVKQDLTERQRKILQLLSERPGIGRKEILLVLQVELRPLNPDFEDLKRLGLIVQTGKRRGSVWHLAKSALN